MKRIISVALIVSLILLSMTVLVSCKKDKVESSNASAKVIIEEKDYLSVDTAISYSAGNDSNWSYGNQRKEFPSDEACYVRIASTAISSKGKGVGNEITVTYKFTGAKNCKIEISDGIVSEVQNDDDNIKEFTKTLYAEKQKNAEEDVVIFKYTPKDSESVVLEIVYDDQIASKYDKRSTVYFENN